MKRFTSLASVLIAFIQLGSGAPLPEMSEPMAQFSTANNPKACGISVNIEYPTGWVAMEGDTGRSVRKIVRPGGLEMINILFIPVPEARGTTIAFGEIKKYSSLEKLKQMPMDVTVFSSEQVVAGGKRFVRAEYQINEYRPIKSRVVLYMCAVGSVIIQINCSVTSLQGDELDIKRRMEEFMPVFERVLAGVAKNPVLPP